MQPITLSIPGEYWDSQIYAGRLYLYCVDGTINTINWDKLIEEWSIEDSIKIALTCAFGRSDFLYGKDFELLFQDDDIKKQIETKFQNLSKLTLNLSKNELMKYSISTQDNKFPFPHTDSEIYNKRMYISSNKGVFSADCNKKTKFPISTKINQESDLPVLSISGSYGSLALAAGDEGLYEMTLNGDKHENNIETNKEAKLSSQNCTGCNWTFYSIYASSIINTGYLADFNKEKNVNYMRFYDPNFIMLYDEEFDNRPYKRKFDKLLNASEIFEEDGYSWGIQDKLCLAKHDKVHIVKYNPWKKELSERFQDLGYIELQNNNSNIVSAENTVFGIIIELDNELKIVTSHGNKITLDGEPVNWRVFPRAKHYENQLHVIYDDHLDILSFNHDYFVDQNTKQAGIRYYSRKPS